MEVMYYDAVYNDEYAAGWDVITRLLLKKITQNFNFVTPITSIKA